MNRDSDLHRQVATALAFVGLERRAVEQVPSEHPLHHLQHRRRQLGLCGQQHAQPERQGQRPLRPRLAEAGAGIRAAAGPSVTVPLRPEPRSMHSDPAALFLARHGQSEWNHQRLVTGQADVALSARGVEQGAALARCLREERLAAIYTSALRRTHATAAATAAAQGRAPVALAALDEIHMGVLQGRRRDESDPEALALWTAWQADPWGFQVPGGERFQDFAGRVQGALAALRQRHAGERILIVGHRATNRVILGTLFGWPRERWAELRLRSKHAYRFEPGAEPAIWTYTLGGSRSAQCEPGFVM